MKNHTKSKKATLKSEKETAIERARNAKNFLPLYSNYYFEKKNLSGRKWLLIAVYVMIMFGIISYASEFQSSVITFFLILSVLVVLYQMLAAGWIKNRKKLLGTWLQPDGAVKQNLFGIERKISYYDLEQEIAGGHMRYGDTGIRVGKGRNRLVFHYEIGDSSAQKHVEECYRELQRYIKVKLLPYEKKGLELLDKKFYYERNRRNHTISLCIALLVFFAYAAGSSLKIMEEAVFPTLLLMPWECFSLYILSRNAALSRDNHEKLQELLDTYPGVNLKGKYAGWVRYILMTVLVIAGNCLIVFAA